MCNIHVDIDVNLITLPTLPGWGVNVNINNIDNTSDTDFNGVVIHQTMSR